MAKVIVTCRNCKKKINRDDAYSTKDRWYFCNKECHDAFYRSDDGDKEIFLDYVWSLYDEEYKSKERFITLSKQADYYHREYGFKYKGMLLAAKWFVETLERKWQSQYGLGQFLPDRYMQLKYHWEEQQRMKKLLSESTNDINKSRVVTAGRAKRRLSLE